jgi:type I restriction enzyme S subunit
VAKIKNGSDHKHLQDGPFPLYGSGGVMRTVEKFSYNKPSVLIPRKGSLKNLFYLDQPFWTVDTIFYTEINDSLVHPKFLFHWLKVQELEKLDVAGGVPSLTQTILNRVMIPLPDISTQIEISEKLDAFSTLLESAITGLPAEIAARRRQYEYYRNKLLTFKELKAS